MRAENGTRYWAVPGREGFAHILGGLEKDSNTGAISTNPENHDLMTRLRQQKIANIQVPDLEVDGDADADLLQALFGRNGESPMPVLAATSPTDCFDAAYQACKIALEHMTPVVLLTDAFVANGSGAFKLPDITKLDAINPPYVPEELKGKWTPYMRAENGTRYWAVPGREGFAHILGGLEKDNQTGAISTNPENHDLMTRLRQQKIANIQVPDLEVSGDVDDADLLIVGFGSTYGHLHSAMDELRAAGKKVAQAHFKFLNPLPANTAEVLSKYKKVVVAEQNMGQLAAYLRMKVDGFVPYQFNQVKGQPFVVEELVTAFTEIINK